MKQRLMKVEKQTLKYEDGSAYYGEIKNGKENGLGIANYLDGCKYEGEYLNGERNGIGIYYEENGKTYMGEFKGNYVYGFCIEESLDYKYEGNYVNGEKCGFGIIIYNDDGCKYIGQFYKGNCVGFGKTIWADGNYFVGEFKNGKRYKGLNFYNEDRGIFDTTWNLEDDGKGEAKGIYYLPNGTKQNRIRVLENNNSFWKNCY